MTTTRAAAETIASARRSRVPLKALAREFAPTTEAEGYGIQEVLHDLLVAEFGAQVGYKIGCTSEMMQQYLAIPHPCAGGYSQAAFTTAASRLHLLISSASASNAKSPSGSRAILRLRKRPSPPISSRKRSRPTSQRSRSFDDGYQHWETLGALTLVAPDFFAAGCVLGESVAPRRT